MSRDNYIRLEEDDILYWVVESDSVCSRTRTYYRVEDNDNFKE